MADGNQSAAANTNGGASAPGGNQGGSGGPKPLMGQNPGRGGFVFRGNRGGGYRGGRGGGRGGRGGGTSGGADGQGSPMPGDQMDMSMSHGGYHGRGKPRSFEDRVMDKLMNFFQGGPTTDIPARETTEVRKFSGHCRLYVGGIPNDLTEEDFIKLFSPFGETSEHFINKDKNFGFIKLDYRSNAERAKNELDLTQVHGRTIRVRYAQHGAIVKVKNLSPWVSNELLEKAMSIFGEVEKAVVAVDARGKALGEGVVEFVQKNAAATCVKMLTEGCLFLTASPKPVIAELVTEQDDDDGLMEKNLQKRHPEFQHEREAPPRFAEPNSFEFEYGQRWKELNELEKQKIEAVKAEIRFEREKLEAQMEYAKQDAEISNLRKQLQVREQEKEERMRRQEEAMRNMEESRNKERAMHREREEQMMQMMTRREEGLRQRALANHRFLQEGAVMGNEGGESFMEDQSGGPGFNRPPARGGSFGPAVYEWEQGQGGGPMEPAQFGGGKFGPGPNRPWGRGPDDRGSGAPDDFQAKRRRF